jgi:hypothetical protein
VAHKDLVVVKVYKVRLDQRVRLEHKDHKVLQVLLDLEVPLVQLVRKELKVHRVLVAHKVLLVLRERRGQ